MSTIEKNKIKGNLGFSIRYYFMRAFKEITCITPRESCENCKVINSCIYNKYFNKVINNTSIKAFIINPIEKNISIDEYGVIRFNLRIFGEAERHRQFFVFALQRMAYKGIGKDRISFNINYIFDKTSSEVLYGNIQEDEREKLCKDSITVKYGKKILLEIITPLRLNNNDFIILSINKILQSTYDKFNLMNEQYGICKTSSIRLFDLDNVKELEKKLKWVMWLRYSGKRKEKIRMGGYVGYILFTIEDEQILSLLDIAKIINVGIGTTFGLGKITYQSV